nr:4-oxalocrotonate tautomerase family protein [uncultured Desulfuromonas sp.]
MLLVEESSSALTASITHLRNQRSQTMPYVHFRITNEGATKEQKAALIKGATQLLVDVLGKNPATTVVTIEEVDTDNWGIGGETVTVLRQKKG